MTRPPPRSTLFPYTTLFRSVNRGDLSFTNPLAFNTLATVNLNDHVGGQDLIFSLADGQAARSEEHTSELQSHSDLVCRLLLEKKKKYNREKQSNYKKRACKT